MALRVCIFLVFLFYLFFDGFFSLCLVTLALGKFKSLCISFLGGRLFMGIGVGFGVSVILLSLVQQVVLMCALCTASCECYSQLISCDATLELHKCTILGGLGMQQPCTSSFPDGLTPSNNQTNGPSSQFQVLRILSASSGFLSSDRKNYPLPSSFYPQAYQAAQSCQTNLPPSNSLPPPQPL